MDLGRHRRACRARAGHRPVVSNGRDRTAVHGSGELRARPTLFLPSLRVVRERDSTLAATESHRPGHPRHASSQMGRRLLRRGLALHRPPALRRHDDVSIMGRHPAENARRRADHRHAARRAEQGLRRAADHRRPRDDHARAARRSSRHPDAEGDRHARPAVRLLPLHRDRRHRPRSRSDPHAVRRSVAALDVIPAAGESVGGRRSRRDRDPSS